MEVLAEVKRVQQINKIILDEVDRICKKYDICYYLDCGALLGAIRHKSFIPWDDDIDISFTRENYERFVEVVSDEWKDSDFFVHKPEDFANNKWLDCITRIVYRNDVVNENTYNKVGKEAAKKIWGKPAIDIFIIDELPEQLYKHKMLCLLLTLDYAMLMGHREYIDYSEYHGIQKLIIKVFSTVGKLFKTQRLVNRYNKHSKKYAGCKGQDCFYSNFSLKDLKKRNKRAWYGKGVSVNIDQFQYNAPEDYDNVLKMNFGNYMELPPEDKRVPKHMNL